MRPAVNGDASADPARCKRRAGPCRRQGTIVDESRPKNRAMRSRSTVDESAIEDSRSNDCRRRVSLPRRNTRARGPAANVKRRQKPRSNPTDDLDDVRWCRSASMKSTMIRSISAIRIRVRCTRHPRRGYRRGDESKKPGAGSRRIEMASLCGAGARIDRVATTAKKKTSPVRAASAAPAASRDATEPQRAHRTDAPTGVDDDILEIFIEEVSEVLDSIDQWLPQWAGEFGNEEALAEVRRAFHTLKGAAESSVQTSSVNSHGQWRTC